MAPISNESATPSRSNSIRSENAVAAVRKSSSSSRSSTSPPPHSSNENNKSSEINSQSHENTKPRMLGHKMGTSTASLVANNSNPFLTNKSARSPASTQVPDGDRDLHQPKGRSSSGDSNNSGSKNPFHKILHHHDDQGNPDHKLRNRARSFLHIRNSHSLGATPIAGQAALQNQHSQHKAPQGANKAPLQRANTSNHVSSLKDKSSMPSTSGGTIAPPRKHDKIVFNPYGLNNGGPKLEKPRDQSFYLEESDVKHALPLPIETPNDYLPADMKEVHVDLTDFYEIPDRSKTKSLGDGASSDVRIINEIGNKHKKYALKKLVLFKGEQPDHFYKRVAAEFVIAKNISNGFHIVTTAELLRVQTTASIQRGWGITMELCEGGDLFSVANSPAWRSVALEEKYCIFKQICFGLKYMHEKDVAHIDLKPENVLLTNNGVVKLTDFGISRFAHKTVGDFSSEVNYITKQVGSAPYSPPEMMELEHNKTVLVEPFKVDMWALGVLLSVLFYSRLPFNEATTKDEAYRRYKLSLLSFENKVNPGMKTIGLGPGSEFQLAEKFRSKEASYMCWRLMDPSDQRRYTLPELFADPFFQKIRTCTDEFTHLDDGEDELCNHDHVFALKEQGNGNTYVSANTSSESLHKPVKSMLDIGSQAQAQQAQAQLQQQMGISRSSSIASNASQISRRSTKDNMNHHSPVKSMLDPLPQTAQQISSLSKDREKSYIGLNTVTNNNITSSSNPSPTASSSPPGGVSEEDFGARAGPNDLPSLAEEAVSQKENEELLSSAQSSRTNSMVDHSIVSLPCQRVNKDTHFRDNDALEIDKEHGLVGTHPIIAAEALEKCCLFDPKSRHRHVDVK